MEVNAHEVKEKQKITVFVLNTEERNECRFIVNTRPAVNFILSVVILGELIKLVENCFYQMFRVLLIFEILSFKFRFLHKQIHCKF